MQNTHVMEQPTEPTLIKAIGEYWGYLAAAVGFLVSTYLTARKIKLFARVKSIGVWIRMAIEAPNIIAQMQRDMVRQDELDAVKMTLQGISMRIERETANLRAALQSMDTAIFHADSHGMFLWANASFLMLVGCDLDEIKGNNWRNALHDLDRTQAFTAWQASVTDRSDFRHKFRISSDKGDFWVQAEAICTKDDLGNVLSFAGELRKIDMVVQPS